MTDLEIARQQDIAPWDLKVDELSDFHVAVFQDRFPVTPGHLLFVPQYNTDEVIIDCIELAMLHGRKQVAQGHCEGFNIGINQGAIAGQTIFHTHMHLIPRRKGDVENPTGGVRNVIPGKGEY